MSDRFPDLIAASLDANGNPHNGATLEFFQTLTSTPKNVYTDSAKTVAATTITSDSAGRFGDIFMDTDLGYKVVWKDPAGVEIDTFDPVFPVLQPGTFPVLRVINKSANYTVLTTDRGATIYVDASSGPVTISLPAAATAASGFFIRVKKTDSSSNAVTIDPDGSETIDGAATVALGLQYDALTITCTGSAWLIDAEKRLPTPSASIGDEIVVVNSAGTGFTTTAAGFDRGHIVGLTTSINATDTTNDIDIAAGEARDAADTADLVVSSAIGKQIDVSWSAGGTPGAPTGGLSSSLTVTNSTWYAIILGLVSGTAEVGFDTSASGANLVTDHSFTNVRRIGWVRRDGAGSNIPYTQIGDVFERDERSVDVNNTTPGTSANLATMAVPPSTLGRFHANLRDTSTMHVIVTSPHQTDVAPTETLSDMTVNNNAVQATTELERFVNSSSQIRYRSSVGSGLDHFTITTSGWTDWRGRYD